MSLALNKRAPMIDEKLHKRYAKMSKADWADLYFDVVHQFTGESMTDEEIMQDAEKRLGILKRPRSASNAKAGVGSTGHNKRLVSC